MMPVWRPIAAVLLSGVVMACGALAQEPASSQLMPAEAGTAVPLYDNLGDLTYPITTNNKLAQRYFDQGLRLTYAFNHAEALRAFRQAQRLDSDCAMCYWGEAFVLGPNINAPMDEAAGNPAVTAITKAQALGAHANTREQALIGALTTRYTHDPGKDRAALDHAFADAMGEAAQRFPDDDEIAVLYVDALMNLAPWDYWEADGTTPKGKIGEAMRTAERVLARNPNHPGAIHLYIHLTEASATPERAEPYANRLAALMPGAGHLVHMPAHTFFRVGRYQDSAEINKAAVKADEAYLAEVKAAGIYRDGYYPHNIHYVLISAQMAGDRQTALEYAKRLEGKIADEAAERFGWIQAIKPAPYFAHVQFSSPDTILNLPDPGGKFPFVQAMWHYARGVAFAAKGEVELARSEAAKIAELNQKTGSNYPADLAGAAPDVLRIARHVVEGRIAQAEGDAERAVKEFRVAVAIQDTLPYLEPPFWYYPVRQSLGAALLEAGNPEEAETAFQQSLEQFPRNGWALYGLRKAQQAQGKAAAAQETEQRFKQFWAGDPSSLDLKHL
ncbi:MAG: tetratricopeptide repeat protein [Candidatus Entotheonellia bacterium]